jgi:hypothetical protein
MTSNSFQHGYALVIGVGADLPVTAQDATGVAQILQDPERCAYQRDNVQLLTGEDARRTQILQAFDRLTQQVNADPDATVVLYFSGHGIERPDFHLLPFGYNLADLPNTAINNLLLVDLLATIRARKLLILLDCCHAGGQVDLQADEGAKAPLPADVLKTLQQGSGRVLLASSRRDEYSYTGRPYSVFTAALLEGFSGYGAFERDGYARVLDLALYIGRMVPEHTNDRQHPIIKVSNLEDNFALAYYAAGATMPKALPWQSSATTDTTTLEPAELASSRRILAERRSALLLIEERMSEFVEYHEIPLQLIKNKRRTEEQIAELEQKLGLQEG